MKTQRRPLVCSIWIGGLVYFFSLSGTLLFSQEPDKWRQQLFKELEQRKAECESAQADLLSPQNYAKANEFYQKALQKFEKGEKLKKIQGDMDQAQLYFRKAMETAQLAQTVLKPVLSWRQLMLQHQFPAYAPERFAAAEEIFQEMVAAIERDDVRAAKNQFSRLENHYKRTAEEGYENGAIKMAAKTLEARRKGISRQVYQKTADELDDLRRWMRDEDNRALSLEEYLRMVDERLRLAVEPLYPPFYRHKPDTLLIGSYTLYVTSYDNAGSYDFAREVITGLNGRARFSLHCGGWRLMPFPVGTQLISHVFRIVDKVTLPEKEISLPEAKLIDPTAKLGGQVTMQIPAKSSKRADIISAKQAALERFKPAPLGGAGEYLVSFKNATIEPSGRNTIGRIIEGDVFYPVSPAASPMEVAIDGFTMLIDSLHLTPSQAQAKVRLAMPSSLIAISGCGPATLNMGVIILNADCDFFAAFPDSNFGPWRIDQTGMVFEGKGYIIDLSSSQSPLGLGLANEWKGVVLKTGKTKSEPTASVIANDGYLRAVYRFNDALVSATGLKANFSLLGSFKYTTLAPFGYSLDFSGGQITLDSSRVQSGELKNGVIDLPPHAVRTSLGLPLSARFTTLTIQRDLDLAGRLEMTREWQWGEFTHNAGEQTIYSALPNTTTADYAFFYLSGAARDHFVPKTDSDFEVFWAADPTTTLEQKQITGVTMIRLSEFKIMTPDIPGTATKSMVFREGSEISLNKSWLNIDMVGINGRVVVQITEKGERLGDPTSVYYKGRVPFEGTLQCERDKQEEKSRYNCFFFLFAHSAVYDSELNGILKLPYPTDAQIPFEDLEVTSTAHLIGGDIDLSGGDITLSYWGLQVTGLSTEPAGVLSVKTGQIILTNAGIKEPRHFAQPFKLFWGEMLADGNWGELFFDYNSANQKFDGFLFTPSYVALSPFQATAKGFLQVCGTNHFNYFGAYYLSIQDSTYSGADPIGVHGGRSVGVLTSSVTGCKASNLHIVKDWGGELADMDFYLEYDKNDQDGFLGEGTVRLPGHFNKDLTASIQIDADQSAISLASRVSTHSTLAGVDIGDASEVWGCVTIDGHTLSCMTLGYTLETTEQTAFGIWGGSGSMVEVKMVIKPTFTSFSAGGRMFISMGIAGGKASMDGLLLLTADFARSIVTGDMQGSFDFGSLFGGLKANGHVNWYLSPTTQYFQGRAEIEVYGRVMGGGASGGIFLGMNVPVAEAWVLTDPSNRYSVNLTGLSAISGVYGYGSVSFSFNFGIFSGGIGIYAGVGAFLTPLPGTLSSTAAGFPLPFPFVLANMGVSLDGEILWGLVSASAWVNLQFAFGSYNYFQGTAGLEGCVLWVLCASVDVTVRLDQSGFHIY